MVNLWAGTISQATVTYFLTDGSVTDTTKQMVPWQVVSQRLETNITSSRDPAKRHTEVRFIRVSGLNLITSITAHPAAVHFM